MLLQRKFRLFLPGTKGGVLDVDLQQQMATKVFRGCTTFPGGVMYINQSGRLVKESVTLVESFANDAGHEQQADEMFALAEEIGVAIRLEYYDIVVQKPRIIVDVPAKTVELDEVRHRIDDVAVLVVDQLVRAKGSWLTRRDMRKHEPGLKNEERIDRIIGRIEEKYPFIGDLIEHDEGNRGYRIKPSVFTT